MHFLSQFVCLCSCILELSPECGRGHYTKCHWSLRSLTLNLFLFHFLFSLDAINGQYPVATHKQALACTRTCKSMFSFLFQFLQKTHLFVHWHTLILNSLACNKLHLLFQDRFWNTSNTRWSLYFWALLPCSLNVLCGRLRSNAPNNVKYTPSLFLLLRPALFLSHFPSPATLYTPFPTQYFSFIIYLQISPLLSGYFLLLYIFSRFAFSSQASFVFSKQKRLLTASNFSLFLLSLDVLMVERFIKIEVLHLSLPHLAARNVFCFLGTCLCLKTLPVSIVFHLWLNLHWSSELDTHKQWRASSKWER